MNRNKSFTDPIVEEVRKIRAAHSAKFHFDLRLIFEDLKKQEKRHKRKALTPNKTRKAAS